MGKGGDFQEFQAIASTIYRQLNDQTTYPLSPVPVVNHACNEFD